MTIAYTAKMNCFVVEHVDNHSAQHNHHPIGIGCNTVWHTVYVSSIDIKYSVSPNVPLDRKNKINVNNIESGMLCNMAVRMIEDKFLAQHKIADSWCHFRFCCFFFNADYPKITCIVNMNGLLDERDYSL